MTSHENNVNEAHGIADLLIDMFSSNVQISREGRVGLVTVLDCLKARIPTDADAVILDRLAEQKNPK